MAESNRVTLAGGIMELAGRLSEEDQWALRAILQSARERVAPEGDGPDVEGFGGDGSDMTSSRLQLSVDQRAQVFELLSNLMKAMSDTTGTITSNLKA